MKKVKRVSFALCLCLMLQWLCLPVQATELTQTTEPTQAQISDATAATAATETAAFGTVCIQNGCRTIEGKVPLAGSDKRLDSAQGAFLYEVTTDTVVYSYNPDMKIHPGTLAKIVAAIVVLENCDLSETVTVTEGIQSYLPAGASKINLKSLEEISVEDLLYAMVLNNANDATVALAHHVTNSIHTDDFLKLMNNWVRRIGCTNTEFGNISGLYTASSSSTARDMAKIVREAIKNEKFVEVFGATEYTIEATNMMEKREFYTGNYLMDQHNIPDFLDERVTGGMQSYHEDLGASIVCTAESKGMTYIAVVLGATRTFAENGWMPLIYGNFNEVSELLQYAFGSFKINRIIYDGMSLSQFSVDGGECYAVGEARVNIDSVVPASAQMDNLYMNFATIDGTLAAPVEAGQLIATMNISYRSSVLAEAEVYAMGDVKSSSNTGVEIRSTAVRSDADGSGFLSAVGTICVIVLGLVALYLAYNSYMRSRMRARRRKRRAARRRNY